MTVKICDRCGNRSDEGYRIVVVSLLNHYTEDTEGPATDLCDDCLEKVREFFKEKVPRAV